MKQLEQIKRRLRRFLTWQHILTVLAIICLCIYYEMLYATGVILAIYGIAFSIKEELRE